AMRPPRTPPLCSLSLHDALPIYGFAERDDAALVPGALDEDPLDLLEVEERVRPQRFAQVVELAVVVRHEALHLLPPLEPVVGARSEEHTSELQSRENLVCRLLLE